jgi:hypothetical protein
LYFEEFGSECQIFNGFDNAIPIGNFAWHPDPYTTSLGKDKRN